MFAGEWYFNFAVDPDICYVRLVYLLIDKKVTELNLTLDWEYQ